MKKTILVAVLIMMVGMTAFAEGVSEQSVREDYVKKGGFPTRDAWVYEFNSVANEVVRNSEQVRGINNAYPMPQYDKNKFDDSCVKYKVLLDIGVELKYITDAVRRQQTTKAEDERRKVAQYLASKSSGLGLE
ncbi:hypothetical protein [Treponema sp. R6D11]